MTATATEASRRSALPVAAVVLAGFLAFSAVRSPVPGINEPHYLAKAKHYWNPDWCAGDLFLESSNAHLVFYQTAGLLTRWLSLEQTAWAGRAAALGLLAFGWTRLVASIVPGRWSPVWAAWCYLAIAALADWSKHWKIAWGGTEVRAKLFDLSGEWLVGGVEAKVFAYAFLFWGLALLGERRWNAAAICGGLAVSFHPVVGIWGLAAAAPWTARPRDDAPEGALQTAICNFRPPRLLLPPAVLLAVFSLPGLVPALWLIGRGTPRESFEADYIQVFGRLAHHLDPMRFPVTAYLSFGALLAFWLTARRRGAYLEHEKLFARFVLAALLIALVGLAAGYGPRPADDMPGFALRMKVLKFYPFRLADLMLPVAASIAIVALAVRRGADAETGTRDAPGGLQTAIPPSSRLRVSASPRLLPRLAFAGAAAFALLVPSTDRDPSRMTQTQRADWLALCRWMAAETPPDALVLTATRSSWAFKWYAGRAEYVAYKDCPQDAAGIVEWNRRLTFVREWARRNYHPRRGYSAAALHELRSEGITHLVVDWPAKFAAPPTYADGAYRVFRL